MRWPWSPSVPEQSDYSETPLPHSWPRRHWKVLTAVAAVVVLVGGGIGLRMWHPWNPCKGGMSYQDSVCVGLDQDSSAFKSNDQLRKLEIKIANDNAGIKGPGFVSIVYLDDLAPNSSDSTVLPDLRHRIEGAITAQQEANSGDLADGTTPKIKLLLANYGTNAGSEQKAVNDIVQNQASLHIAAVTGIGQSLVNTRKAVADLSKDNIVTVGSIASADDMNTDPKSGQPIPNFFRVNSTNMDEATAAAAYMAQHNYRRVLLFQDQNLNDDYVRNLGSDVTVQARNKGISVDLVNYTSPGGSLYETSRSSYMFNQFRDESGNICNNKPDLIYFTGRGVDLRSFLNALAASAICGDYQPRRIVVLSGDDAVSMGSDPIHKWGNAAFNVYYTAVATGNEWTTENGDKKDSLDYGYFATEFRKKGFAERDLTDGHAIMTYDAILTAADAARNDDEIVKDPSRFHPGYVSDSFPGFDCPNPVPGAGGQIAFPAAANSPDHGDPSDKPIPIMQFQPNGQARLAPKQPMEWPVGSSFAGGGCGKYSS